MYEFEGKIKKKKRFKTKSWAANEKQTKKNVFASNYYNSTINKIIYFMTVNKNNFKFKKIIHIMIKKNKGKKIIKNRKQFVFIILLNVKCEDNFFALRTIVMLLIKTKNIFKYSYRSPKLLIFFSS